jgi:hypothetical protein
MIVIVHSSGKWIIFSRNGASTLKYEIPNRTKFLKEELRIFRETVTAWLGGKICDQLIAYKPVEMSFYRRVFYQAVLKAIRRKDGLVLLTTYRENAKVIR